MSRTVAGYEVVMDVDRLKEWTEEKPPMGINVPLKIYSKKPSWIQIDEDLDKYHSRVDNFLSSIPGIETRG